MALVRVYCGLASADHARSDVVGKALTIAVVDDSGRLLDVRDISDDPAGYAHLSVVLAERSSGPAGVAIATDSDDHYLTTLLTAAGRPLAFADDDAVDDFAERFADDESIEEIESSPAQRRAIGLARALQAGVLSAVVQSVPREMAALKPVLAAHAAVAVGRQAAAVALREVLRELYPAALRAYPDPAEPVPLVVLDALPEPGLVNGAGSGRGHDSADALAHQLAETGVGDAATIAAAVTALRVAVAETPRRNGTGRAFADAVATTVRQAVAAVRACDAASTTLITAIAQRTAPDAAASGYGRTHAAHQAPGGGALRAAREGTAEHARIRVPLQRRGRAGAAPASAPPAAATSAPPAATSAPPAGTSAPLSAPPAPSFDGHRTRSVPPPPPGMTPMAPEPVSPAPQPVSPAAPFRTTVTITPGTGADDTGFAPRQPAATNPAPPGSRANWPLVGNADDRAAGIGPREPDPILGDPYASAPSTNGASLDLPQRSDDRVTPPWRADDLPPEPPMLRLVEPPPLPDPALHRTDGDERGSRRFEAPPLRLVDSNASDHNGARANPPGPGAAPISVPPVAQEDGDEDLLIFTATRSAWFGGSAGDGERAWGAADEGWRAAEQAARPAVAVQTGAGLPKRVPKANLVPGSPMNGQERPLRIVRDPARIAEHTSGYFRGWRRGQQAGGYGRPGHEGPQGWNSTRDSDQPDYEDGYQYRAAGGYRSR